MRRLLLLFLFLILLALPCCGPYKVQGRVVQGDISYIAVVDKDDPRLAGEPVDGVLLRLDLKPERVDRLNVAQETSTLEGDFRLPVDEWGAGLIHMDAIVLARRFGYSSAEGVFRLPGSDKRLLIVLAPGEDPPGYLESRDSVTDTLRRYGADSADDIEAEVNRYR